MRIAILLENETESGDIGDIPRSKWAELKNIQKAFKDKVFKIRECY